MQIPIKTESDKGAEIQRVEQRLDDRVMDLMISGAANHSSKLVLLASMDPDQIYTLSGNNTPKSLIAGAQKGYEENGWIPDYNVPFGYLSKSLAPVGMVTKEYIDVSKGAVGYQLNELGRERGVPLAGLLLDFASRYNFALSQVFGDTTSRNPEARAGEIRWKIFQGLATQLPNEPTSATELAHSIGTEPSRTISNLQELAEIGLVSYEPGTQRPAQQYKIDIAGLRDYLPKMRSGESAEIARFLTSRDVESAHYSVAELASELTVDNPQKNTPTFRSYVKTILGNWEDRGYTTREVELAGDAKVWVDDQQQAILTELVQILDDIQTGKESALTHGKHLAAQVLSDPLIVSGLLGHEKIVSVHYKGQKNAAMRAARIMGMLEGTGGELSYDDISIRLRELGDIVAKNSIARVLKGRPEFRVSNSPGKQGTVSLNQ